jgi:hypothetical protein
MPSLLTLSDVVGTGHHAAVTARSRLATRSPATDEPLHVPAAAARR